MFEGLDLNKLLQKAGEMQREMQQKKEEGKNKFHTISIGGGMVELVVNEEIELKSVKIDKELLKPEELSTLEELLLLGFNQAVKKAKEQSAPDMNDMMKNLQNTFSNPK
jgi:DNA-binding YbaB/EbfC family protein